MTEQKIFRKIKRIKIVEARNEILTEESQCDFRYENGERCKNFRTQGKRFCDTHAIEHIPTGRTPISFNLLKWMKDNNFKKNGEPFSFEDYPFMIPIYADPHPDKTIMKASQLSVTEFGVNFALACCSVLNGTSVIYTMPAKPDASRLSKQRISTVVAENKHLFVDYKKTEFGKARKEKEHYDSVLEKQIKDSFLHLQGTWMDKQAISIPADLLIHDEINFCKGDILGKFRSRLGNSRRKWRLIYSTPTWPEVGVHKEFLQTDQNHWMYKCENCGFIFKLCCAFPDIVQFDEDSKEYYFGCQRCKKEIARKEGWYKPDFPNAKRRGYHISRLCSPRVVAQDMIDAREDYKLERDFWNFELGLPFAGSEDKLNDGDFDKCVNGNYHLMVRDQHTVLGVDQGGNDLWVVCLKPRTDKKYQLIWVDHLVGKNSWKELSVMMNQLGVVRCVVDGMPDSFKAKEFQDSWSNGKIYLCFYDENKKAKEPILWQPSKGIVTANRSYTLDDLCNRVRTEGFIFPDSEKLKPMFQHMKSLIRQKIENPDTGEVYYEYKKIKRDHLAHALNYACIAANKLDLKPFSVSVFDSKSQVQDGTYSDDIVNFFAKQLYFSKLTKQDVFDYRCARKNGKLIEEMGFDKIKTSLLFDAEMKFGVGKILESISEFQIIEDRIALVGKE